VATERQIAANRRNARNSTGPRTRAGKQNAYRHGLSLRTREATARHIEQLARKIGGDSKDGLILEHARNAARATIDLATVRRVRLALIERASALGALESPRLFRSAAEARRFLVSIERGEMPIVPQPVGISTMPLQEPERTAEAVRRALPELIKLDRYESRAAARRDKAFREIARSR
jgi:hypothetical protein